VSVRLPDVVHALEKILLLTGRDRLLEIFDGTLLALEATALLVVKPAKLLQDFGMIGVSVQNSTISKFGIVVLRG
jgi:hypothetical protein